MLTGSGARSVPTALLRRRRSTTRRFTGSLYHQGEIGHQCGDGPQRPDGAAGHRASQRDFEKGVAFSSFRMIRRTLPSWTRLLILSTSPCRGP